MAVDEDEANAAEFQSSLRTARLEMAHERELHRINTMLCGEDERRLHIRLLLAEHDRDEFRSQLQNATVEIGSAESMRSEAELQLKQLQDNMAQLQRTLRDRLREIERLTAEVENRQTASQDLTKLKTENLALTREIAVLKPEIDHLRSQNASRQSVVSEKLALERQMTSLKVELENTNRSLDRLRSKDAQQNDVESQANLHVELLNKQYLREKQERERIEEEASADAQHRKVLESKLKRLEDKLEEATDQLQQAQGRLQHQIEARMGGQQVPLAGEESDKQSWAMRFDPNLTIATPGDVKLRKKPQRVSTLPGAKSSFSITPFLNRTSKGSVISQDEDEESDIFEQEITREKPKGKEKSSGARTRKAPSSSIRAKPKAKAAKSSSAQELPVNPRPADPLLDQSNDNEREPSLSPIVETGSRASTAKGKAARTKTRVLGGKLDRTLFDEDEGDFNGARKARAGSQSLNTQGLQPEVLRPVRRLGTNTTLDTGFNFSPLKRKTRPI